jgi:hypothetical protein
MYPIVYKYFENSFVQMLFTQSEQHVGKLMYLTLSKYLISDNNKWKKIALYTLKCVCQVQ